VPARVGPPHAEGVAHRLGERPRLDGLEARRSDAMWGRPGGSKECEVVAVVESEDLGASRDRTLPHVELTRSIDVASDRVLDVVSDLAVVDAVACREDRTPGDPDARAERSEFSIVGPANERDRLRLEVCGGLDVRWSARRGHHMRGSSARAED